MTLSEYNGGCVVDDSICCYCKLSVWHDKVCSESADGNLGECNAFIEWLDEEEKGSGDKELEFISKAFNDWVKFYIKQIHFTEDEMAMIRLNKHSDTNSFLSLVFLAGYRLGSKGVIN